MLMMMHLERCFAKSGRHCEELPLSWTLEGRAFVIPGDHKDDFVKQWLPMFFPQGKFSSFTRKLYRWGFRQVCFPTTSSSGARRPLQHKALTFAHPYFQREHPTLMAFMQSVTAAGERRKAEREHVPQEGGGGEVRRSSLNALGTTIEESSCYHHHPTPNSSFLGGYVPPNSTAAIPNTLSFDPTSLNLIGSLLQEQILSQHLQDGAMQLLRLGMLSSLGPQQQQPLMPAFGFPPAPSTNSSGSWNAEASLATLTAWMASSRAPTTGALANTNNNMPSNGNSSTEATIGNGSNSQKTLQENKSGISKQS